MCGHIDEAGASAGLCGSTESLP